MGIGFSFFALLVFFVFWLISTPFYFIANALDQLCLFLNVWLRGDDA